MKITKEITLILGIGLIATFLTNWISLPASILALLILLVLLIAKRVKTTQIEQITSFLLLYMPLFFIPATVRIMDDYIYIAPQLLQYLIIVIITTCLTFFIAGSVVMLLMKGVKK